MMDSWSSLKKNLRLVCGMIRSACGDPDAWESSITSFEKKDRIVPPAAESILLIGSSTFTLWSSLESDMSPLPVMNRAFGGSKIADVTHYAHRIVIPYKPSVIVLFVGTNDIAWPKPATAQHVFQGYLDFVRCVQSSLPGTHIYYLSITPTPARWKYWPVACEANTMIRDYSRRNPNLHFIESTQKFLGPDGKPDKRLFRLDRLHPNSLGYALLATCIKKAIRSDMVS